MKVVIVGWYGTETIGDRAILAGIFDMLSKAFGDFEVKLGSLFPFFTRRTLAEDAEFYHALLEKNLKGELFESKKINDLDQAIKDADLVLIGGGPLMHINDLFMLEYALKRSKKLGKPNMVFGCGVGPLFKKRHIPALWGIMKYADKVILRDQGSLNYMESLSSSKTKTFQEKIQVAIDPSVQAIQSFKEAKHFKENKEPYFAVNLRDFPAEYAKSDIGSQVNQKLSLWLKDLISSNPDKEIRLVPMHYFHIGNDDRAFMNRLKFAENIDGVKVQNEPLNLFETMLEFQEAEACYGMRFHSVIFQTLLNGNNYVLDYTEPKKGKISGFLSSVDSKSFYADRYVNLQSHESIKMTTSSSRFQLDDLGVKQSLSIFEEALRTIG